MPTKPQAFSKTFKLTPNLYSMYLKGLLVAAFFNHKDRAKAFACKVDLAEIYRFIPLRVLYLQLGATSRGHKDAVKAGLSQYYTLEKRGSNLSQQVSRWQNIGRRKPVGVACARVLTHYCLLNQDALMTLEKSLYTAEADRTEPTRPVCLELTEMNAFELRELIALVGELEAQDAAERAKKPRKPRAPDTEETKAKKRAAAQARCVREAAARAELPLAA